GALVPLCPVGWAAAPQRGPAATAAGAPATRSPGDPGRPADRQAYHYVAAANYYAQASDLTQAVAELKKALDRDAKTPALWLLLARWLGRQNALDEAVAAARQASTLDPSVPAPYLTLAELFH